MIRHGLALVAAGALCGGCSLAVSDIDEFGGGEPASTKLEDARCGDGFSLCLDLTGFSPHVDERFEVALARGKSIRARAVLDPFSYPDNSDPRTRDDQTLSLGGALRTTNEMGGEFEVLFFADHDMDMDGVFTPPPDRPDAPFPDHAWRQKVPEDGQVVFEHAADFQNLAEDTPRNLEGDFSLTIQGMTSHDDETLFLWVVNRVEPERTVGFYRLQKIPQQLCNPDTSDSCTDEELNPFTIELKGILDEGESYRVEFFADHEVNQVYDGQPEDHSWTMEFEADADGWVGEFVHTGEFDDLTPPPTLAP